MSSKKKKKRLSQRGVAGKKGEIVVPTRTDIDRREKVQNEPWASFREAAASYFIGREGRPR